MIRPTHLYDSVDSTGVLVEVTTLVVTSPHYTSPPSPVLSREYPSEQIVLGPQFRAGGAVSSFC